MPFGLGIWEILILAGVLVLLFGAKGAPGMARRFGTGVKEMKDAVTELDPVVLDPKESLPKRCAPAGGSTAAGPAAAAAAVPEPAARAPVAPALRHLSLRPPSRQAEGEPPAS